MTQACTLVEVSPRDGLQNESRRVATGDKLRLIGALADAGLRRIEAASFVNPARVPQMADADAVMAGVPRERGIAYSGLVLNERGAERALAAGCDELTFVVVASDALGRRNQGQSTDEGLAVWSRVARLARTARRRACVMIAAAFGCPFEGRIDPARVLEIADRACASEPDELALADTIGVGTPGQVASLFGALRKHQVPLRAHFHNTRNTGYANAYAAILAGVAALDSSAGGLGGCPFAPGATGNIATEDLTYLLDGLEVEHGIDAGAVAALDGWLAGLVGHAVPAQLGKVPAWPPASAGSR
jgi:hydroxymethylglutaryl-CoA lyase